MQSKLAQALFQKRNSAAAYLAEPLPRWSKFAASSASLGAEAFARLETVPLVDFLIRYFETQDRTWRDLYIGERIKQVHVSTDNVEQNLARRTRILSGDRDSLGKLLAGELDPSDREQLDVLLSEALRLATASTQEVHALFVGDCLLFHIASFCVTALLEVGITLRPTYEPSKNPFDLRNSIQKLDCGAFDLVSYSPYSYEFSLLMSQTFHMRSLGYSRRKLEDIARDASDQTTLTLGLLADKFACPVAVHCTAHIRAYHDSWRSYAVTVATRPVRQRVADLVNAVLDQQIAEYNQTASRPFLVIDERPVVLKYGERELGKRLYDAIYYHPTVLSAHLAKFYPSLLASAKYLLSKKVIVTDLDNTLWEGLVGEGPVQHQRHRQQVLKRLRQKGIVLAIASKNDQKCIHWYGAVLSEDDFVAMEINWENKALNIQRIAAKLNLDLRDFVFIDDRDEELEIVRRALPQVRVLSANSEWTWQMLEWWVAALPNQGSADRTQLYREREERESYLAARLTADQDQILSSLGLMLNIDDASPKDLGRIVELVNRTHQFNTTGEHVSPQQVSNWMRDTGFRVMVGEAADKFGTMGLVSVMIVKLGLTEMEIQSWVLSCRVFGYGIETAMLNHAKQLAHSFHRDRIRGHLIATSQNGPCQQVYSKHGFESDGATFVFSGKSMTPDPPWLLVNRVEAKVS